MGSAVGTLGTIVNLSANIGFNSFYRWAGIRYAFAVIRMTQFPGLTYTELVPEDTLADILHILALISSLVVNLIAPGLELKMAAFNDKAGTQGSQFSNNHHRSAGNYILSDRSVAEAKCVDQLSQTLFWRPVMDIWALMFSMGARLRNSYVFDSEPTRSIVAVTISVEVQSDSASSLVVEAATEQETFISLSPVS